MWHSFQSAEGPLGMRTGGVAEAKPPAITCEAFGLEKIGGCLEKLRILNGSTRWGVSTYLLAVIFPAPYLRYNAPSNSGTPRKDAYVDA